LHNFIESGEYFATSNSYKEAVFVDLRGASMFLHEDFVLELYAGNLLITLSSGPELWPARNLRSPSGGLLGTRLSAREATRTAGAPFQPQCAIIPPADSILNKPSPLDLRRRRGRARTPSTGIEKVGYFPSQATTRVTRSPTFTAPNSRFPIHLKI
jgi:hypothetical protein